MYLTYIASMHFHLVKVRGHLCETISVSHHMGSRDQNPLISIIGKHLYLLSYLSVPKINTLVGEHSGPKDELRGKAHA